MKYSKKFLFIILTIFGVFVLSGCSYNKVETTNEAASTGLGNEQVNAPRFGTTPEGTTTNKDEANLPSGISPIQTEFSLTDIAQHDDARDCWMAINGKVYDVTTFIRSHPGGNAIVEGCGIDATTLFETRPMGSGKPHSGRARSSLEAFYIGELK